MVAVAAPQNIRERIRFTPANVLPATAWLFIVLAQLFSAPLPPSPSTVMVILINTVTVGLFLIRRPATKVGNLTESTLAYTGAFLVALLPATASIYVAPTAIEVLALCGWAYSLLTLGRSFGIVPADRGLVRQGPYRFVRHPIYAFEMVFFFAYTLGVMTPQCLIIVGLWCAIQVLRITREERIIAGYEAYKRTTRWRLLPGVW